MSFARDGYVMYRVNWGAARIQAPNSSVHAPIGERCDGAVAFYVPFAQKIVKLRQQIPVTVQVQAAPGVLVHGTVIAHLTNPDRALATEVTAAQVAMSAKAQSAKRIAELFKGLSVNDYLDRRTDLETEVTERCDLSEVGFTVTETKLPYVTAGDTAQFVSDIHDQIEQAHDKGLEQGYNRGYNNGWSVGYITSTVAHHVSQNSEKSK